MAFLLSPKSDRKTVEKINPSHRTMVYYSHGNVAQGTYEDFPDGLGLDDDDPCLSAISAESFSSSGGSDHSQKRDGRRSELPTRKIRTAR